MYIKKKLLFLCDSKFDQLSLVEKSLLSINIKINEIILHCAYQIPSDPDNVIKKHDEIKLEAKKRLKKLAEVVLLKTGIKTSIKLSLGSGKNTLKKILSNNNISFVVSDDDFIETSIKKDFPDINFIEK